MSKDITDIKHGYIVGLLYHLFCNLGQYHNKLCDMKLNFHFISIYLWLFEQYQRHFSVHKQNLNVYNQFTAKYDSSHLL